MDLFNFLISDIEEFFTELLQYYKFQEKAEEKGAI